MHALQVVGQQVVWHATAPILPCLQLNSILFGEVTRHWDNDAANSIAAAGSAVHRAAGLRPGQAVGPSCLRAQFDIPPQLWHMHQLLTDSSLWRSPGHAGTHSISAGWLESHNLQRTHRQGPLALGR